MNELRYVALAVLIMTFLIFDISTLFAFERVEPPNWKTTILLAGAMTTQTVIAGTALVAQVRSVTDAGGLVLVTLAAGLFVSSLHQQRSRQLSLAFSGDQPTFLLRSGPYGYIRHPCYAAYLLTYLGGTLIAPSLWTIVLTAAMAGIYYCAARYEERKFFDSALRIEYRNYRCSTGMLLPRLRREAA